MTWHVRDFAPEDLEAAIRLDADSTMTTQKPLFDASDVVTSLQGRHPAVVAVARGAVVGVAVSRVDADRAWVLRLSLDPAWRGKGLGSNLLAELEHRLLARGVRRITAMLPDGETGTAAFVNSGFVQRTGIAHFDKHETMSPRSAAVLSRLGGAVPPAGQWQQIAGMVHEKNLIERRIVLPLSRPGQAAEHGVMPPQAIVLVRPAGHGQDDVRPRDRQPPRAGRSLSCFRHALRSATVAWRPDSATPSLNWTSSTMSSPSSTKSKRWPPNAVRVRRRRRPSSTNSSSASSQFRDRSGRLLVCATNSVRDLDSAFLRHGRFDYVLPIGPPDDQARDALWRRYVADPGIDVAALVSATRGYTPADVTHVARAVAQATFERSVDGGVRCHASTADYLRTVEATRPTLTPEQVSEFDTEIAQYARS